MSHLFCFTGHTGREERLLGRTVGGDNRPFLQRISSDSQKDLSRTLQGFTDPDAIREETLNDNRDKLQAFMSPDIFTVQAQPSAAGRGGNKERLLSMTPVRRLEEFTSYVNTQVPEAVRAKYDFLFNPPLDEQDIFDYEGQSQEGRIRILLTALSSLNGTRIPPGQNPTADMLALDISAEKNNAADSPGSVFRLYEQWLDSKPGISETDATTPEILLKSSSGIPDRLRGDLTNLIDPAVQQSMLKEMYELYRNRRTDDNLTLAQAKVDQLQLTGSVEKKRLEQQSRGLVENFRNADPRLQLAMGVVGAYAVWKILKAKNPIGRWALAGGVGYFAYDRFVNGNENALNDMAKLGQKTAQAGGNLLKNLARELGLPIARNQQDQLELMAQFITENNLNIPGHEAMTGMSALSGVKLGTIAAAFTPYMDGEQLGGSLIIDDGQSQSRGGKQSATDVSGNLLHKSLMLQMGAMGLSGREKTATINYLQSNNASVSKALTHAMYMLAMDETSNVKRAQEIENALVDYGSYDNLPANLKRQYMEIAFQGKMLAETTYKDMSLVDVIADLQVRRKDKVEKKDDPAVEVPDVKTPARSNEFALIENTSNLPITTTVPNDILRDNGLADKDASEFLRNCEVSGILTADAALEIARRFDKIRRETPQLTEALQIIEKLKYAILVQSTKQESPLSQDDIILLVGPDDLDATAILNRVTGLISRFAISLPGRGFGSVASLGDVRSLITEPWFGSGPVQSQGEGFKRLTDRMNVYDKKLAELKDTNVVAKQMAGALPDSVALSFGGRDKLETALRTLVPSSNYTTRINRAEQHLSQRMANALSRTMRLTHERDGFGRFDELGVTPIEQKNLASEFDLLFVDVMGDPLKGISSMWQRMEDVDIFQKFDISAIDIFDYSTEAKRLEVAQYARDLGALYLISKGTGQNDPSLRSDLAARVLKIEEKLIAAKKKALDDAKVAIVPSSLSEEAKKEPQIKNLHAALLIENDPSYGPAMFTDVQNVLRILEAEPNGKSSFKDMYPADSFPPNYERPGFQMPQFLKEFDYNPIQYWKDIFYGSPTASTTTPTGTPGTGTNTPAGTPGTPTTTPAGTPGTPTTTPAGTPGTPTTTPAGTPGTPTTTPAGTLGTGTNTPAGTPGTGTNTPAGTPGTPTTTPAGTPGTGTNTPAGTPGTPSNLPENLTNHPEVQRLQTEMDAIPGLRPDYKLQFSLSPDPGFGDTIEYRFFGIAEPSQLARSSIAQLAGMPAAEVLKRYIKWLGRIDLPDNMRELPENKDALTLGIDTPAGTPPAPPDWPFDFNE